MKMFPNKIENADYDFLKPENYERWKGTFANSLDKVLEQVHPSLNAAEEALLYVEELILTLMGKLCAKPSPHTILDVEERVGKTFPNPIDQWALNDARESHKTKKKRPVLPVDKIHQMLQKDVFMCKIEALVTSFIVAIVEYIAADILKLAGNYVKKISNDGGFLEISSQDIKTSMNADKALMEMFYQEQVTRKEKGGERALAPPLEPSRTPRASLTYDELVRDLMNDEKQYLRDLHLIIRVFREEIEKILPKESKDVEMIFGNIVEIYELTLTLLGSLEDTVESASETQMPHIGICFEELAEAEEFDVYVRYAQIVTTQGSREALQAIVDNPELSERLDTAGHGFRLAVKYFLPKLLASPITHAILYFDYVAMLLKLAPCTEDMESFQQVEGLMRPIHSAILAALDKGPTIEAATRMASRARRQVALEKTNELAKLIDNWDNRDIGLCCNEFIREDTLGKVGPGKRITERRGFLFDGLLLLCKPCTGDKTKSELKLKERLYIRKLEIIDKPDTDEVRNCMELAPKCGHSVTLCCTGAIDKNRWMADLVMLNTKNMLDRTLDSILLDLERKHPLKLPPPSLYRFAIPDSPDNIVLEERQNAGVPLIKGATLLKLVERLTYHIYADPMFVKTFLTTYRSFCKPPDLLDLLIERFNIPDPSLVYDAPEKGDISSVTDTEKLTKNSSREDFKRYRKEFLQPVQFRVLNVLRHWVDQHFYDFEREPSLLDKLRTFLNSITGKPMLKWVESVIKIVTRKIGHGETRGASSPSAVADSLGGTPAPVFDNAAPPIERLTGSLDRHGWHILILHPIEVARQLTLLEFDMYRMVKPSELVGAAWTKKDKEIASPNLLRIIKHTTNFTRWIEKSIVEAENLEERGAVLRRMLEVMMVLRELNNFNGVLAVVSAMGSASVFRLKFTFQMLTTRLEKALEECRELNSDHFRRYQERLRSINPPCVPFFGMYLTNILHIEDGNRDFLPNSELINFSKRRKVAEIIGEIQQYQNQPYCLTVEPKLRQTFLENLNPFPGKEDTEIRDYLYNKSLEIEPRDSRQAPKFARKWPELRLKSPGIKPARARAPQHSTAPSASEISDDMSTSQLSPTASMCDDQSSTFGSLANLQQAGNDEEPPSPRQRFLDRISTSVTLNRHSSISSSSTSILSKDHGGFESTSPRLPSTSITELTSRMKDNFASAPPPVSPRPPSTLSSKNQDSSNSKVPAISPRVANPAISLINKGTNESGAASLAKEATPLPPPRNFPSPDHQMVEFRNQKFGNWPNSTDNLALGCLYDGNPSRLPAAMHMSCEEKHHRIVNDIISNVNNNQFSNVSKTSPRIGKPPVLSPRNPIVDANGSVNWGFSSHCDPHIFTYNNSKSKANDPPDVSTLDLNSKPPLLGPKNNEMSASKSSFNLEVDRTNKPNRPNGDVNVVDDNDDPPLIVPRSKEQMSYGNNASIMSSISEMQQAEGNRPPTPPERPHALSPRSNSSKLSNDPHKQGSIDEESETKYTYTQSPKTTTAPELFARFVEISPKITSIDLYPPGTHPPLSPHVNVLNSIQNYEKLHGTSMASATFSFPSLGSCTSVSPSWTSMSGPRPSPTMAQSYTGTPHTPPPLPPRRRRDSTPAATPIPTTAQPSPTYSSSMNVPAVPPRGSSSPPPLPPRPTPSAPLLGPDHSTILQRRHLNNTSYSSDTTPELPPKPRPSTTTFLSSRISHTRQETQ